MHLEKFLLAFIICLSFAFDCKAQTTLDSLNQIMEQIESQDILPGFAIAIVSPEKILFESGYGYANIQNKKAYTPNTLHNIGSVSKTFIAAAVAKCIEDGLLSLDTKVNDILSFKIVHPKYPDEEITLRHLVTHTSGIHDSNLYGKACYVIQEGQKINKKKYTIGERLEIAAVSKSKMMDLGDFLKKYLVPKGKFYKAKNFQETKPGAAYHYSNIGSALAAYVVEVVTKIPYDRFVVEEVMKPLGMTSSGFKFEEIDMDKHATLYSKKGGVIPRYSLVTYPDGGVLSSTHDLCIYIQEMMKGYYGGSNFITGETYKTLFQKLVEKSKDKSAIFWSIDKHDFINHNGADPGIFTFVQFHPNEKFGMVFTTNCGAHINEQQIAAVKTIWKSLYKKGRRIAK